jgi:dolichyl-phosphate-mannose--protein O-mannosyl transferase
MLYFLSRERRAAAASQRYWQTGGALLIVGAASALLYLAVFLPHFFLGWWAGIQDLLHYYGDVFWYERSVKAATHPYSSPWWSWPLMLRPIAYWQDFPPQGKVATIWGGGNPLLWWSAFTAITITAVRLIERSNPARAFLVIGYLGYLVIWVWVGRTLFLYHYMPSVYLGYLALGAVVADMWQGGAETWECAALLLTMVPVFILGLGPLVGLIAVASLFAACIVVAVQRPEWASRLVAVAFLITAGVLFIYYFPVWTAIPIQRASYYARMWLQGPGLRNWI